MSLDVVILAAGQGKRMCSSQPKVLHALGGKPMLERVVETAIQLNPSNIHVIIGHGGEQIRDTLSALPVHWVFQAEQLGTGHAVLQALPTIPAHHAVLVLSADVPLIRADILKDLIEKVTVAQVPLGLLLAMVDDPRGLGRIIRDAHGAVVSIVEEKDATSEQKKIREIYTGICCARAKDLTNWLPQLNSSNAQKEYYLTDIISMAVAEQKRIDSILVNDPLLVRGVNNRLQLSELERAFQRRLAHQLMESGVAIADSLRIDIRGELECERDVFIDINVLTLGKVILMEGSQVGPNCTLKNVVLGKNSQIHANSVLEDCVIGDHCEVGPFARLRPGTVLGNDCKVGNFVETKNAVFDHGSKANHLTYLGDVTIGKKVNIGAGTITCNYDGANKHQTIIEDGVFIGSDTQLVAPVTIGKNATVGAGSTIRKSVPSDELTLTESRQKTVYGWVRPKKKALKEV
jgi:bifunctional UDP-N-acetylglucosamine pyrophosphorylase/glucosamine-1-phosphate N-acetyltransferase